ncbi:DUF262 domain-containing protein [Flavobacterium branchiophilum]|uniref:GmrSD restriction endonucleases N-terminal domain-containing protein n=1 Tax=Flavobacterium branchiophilum TaxID=55197 RepID=A0A2H3K9K0_9FLAO|nr:DUF262 domain-containing protein [Flavobacterium branchiophilum]PDS22775.1 hypothetical protein B0A77_12725 [Flavobacterium branchiophilum]
MADNKILNLYPIDYPFETLVDRVSKGKLVLDPEFQRKYKWDKDGNERASKFIESCLMRIPLPACYFAEKEDNSQEVIDGVQRITTILNFFNDKFALEGLSIFTELEGKKFSELGDLKSELETTTIRCIVLRKDNRKELVNEIFARLNQGAVELTPQEIRHAVYPGNFDNLLQKLSNIEIIKNFKQGESGTQIKDGREAEELVLRFFALNNSLDDYDNKLTKYLDTYMKSKINAEMTEIVELESLFISTLTKCTTIFEINTFVNPNKQQPRQSVALYDLLMWSMANESEGFLNSNKIQISEAYTDLCNMPEFSKTMAGGLQQKHSIITRRNLWTQKILNIKNNG